MDRPRLELPAPVSRPRLDENQAAAVAWAPGRGHLLVVGAPGTGKTTAAVEAVVARTAGERPAGGPGEQGVLLLVPTRAAAARARDLVAARLATTTSQVLVRTPASFAYSVLRMRAGLRQEPAPTLVTGPEQDRVLAELLAGHRAGDGATAPWPDGVDDATLALPAFRAELRDLLMRAAELGLDAVDLDERGRRYGRTEWRAAAVVLQEYHDVTRLGELTPDRGARLDAARIVDEATAALAAWEAEVPGHPRPRWSTVVVDDHQDSTLATARLLKVLADDGAQLLLHGDPDTGVQGFRGGTPALVGLAETSDRLGGFAATRIQLGTVHRGGPKLRALTARVTGAVSAAGSAGQRRAGAPAGPPAAGPGARGPDGPGHAVLASAAQEGAYVARLLREEHLRHGTPWSGMAVIVRSAGQVAAVQRALRSWRVPARTGTGAVVLREEPAVRPLLLALEVALARSARPADAIELLTSPVGGADAVTLRVLRRTLRGLERAAGGDRTVEELLAAVVTDPELAAGLPAAVRTPAGRAAAVVAATAAALERPGATAETVLWAAWAATGLAGPWRAAALAGGPAGDRADADLDAVMALFRAAEQHTDRTVGAGPAGFLAHLREQDLPADTLAAQGRRGEAVQILTPAAAAGQEWEVVVVAGLQEDVWPDLRLRDSLLGAGALLDVEAGRSVDGRRAYGPARRQVLDDELRMLGVAVSRATRRLVATAVLDEEQRPSTFFDLLAPDADPTTTTPVPAALDLRGLVAELRRALERHGADPAHRVAAADLLAHLADHGVAGADPGTWAGLAPVSNPAPLRPAGEPVTVSPSALEQASTCPLRWALEQGGGRREASAEQSLGTLVHEIAADHPHGTRDELYAALEARWQELGLGQGWLARRERARAEAMIDRLAGYLAAVPGEVEVEKDFAADVGLAHLRGRMDRVEHLDDGTVRVVDLKTSASPVSAAQALTHAQLGAYQVAVDAGAWGQGTTSGGARLVYLGTGRSATLRHQPRPADADDPAWAHELVTRAAETMAGAEFDAVRNENCLHCPVRTSCPIQEDGGRVTS